MKMTLILCNLFVSATLYAGATIDNITATIKGDDINATGTVDGKNYTVHVWKSYLDTLPTKAAKRQYVAQELKKLADADAPAAIDFSGTPIVIP